MAQYGWIIDGGVVVQLPLHEAPEIMSHGRYIAYRFPEDVSALGFDLQQIKEQDFDELDVDVQEVRDLGLGQGWARITTNGDELDVQTGSTPLSAVVSKVRSLSQEHMRVDGNFMTMDIGGKYFGIDNKPALAEALRYLSGKHGSIKINNATQQTFTLPWDQTAVIFKNPGDAEFEFLKDRYAAEVGPRSVADDTPRIRTTYDQQGNEYAWMALDGIHSTVEDYLERQQGGKYHQNKEWAVTATKQTDSPEFKAWFGDSKVIDAEGKPIVCYHGTTASFNSFYNNQYFVTSSAYASGLFEGQDGASVYPVYLSVKNPLSISQRGMEDANYNQELIENAIEGGYDGLVNTAKTVYVVFNPSQIKSAIGNKGTFDPESADITAAKHTASVSDKEYLAAVNENNIKKAQHMVDAAAAAAGYPVKAYHGSANFTGNSFNIEEIGSRDSATKSVGFFFFNKFDLAEPYATHGTQHGSVLTVYIPEPDTSITAEDPDTGDQYDSPNIFILENSDVISERSGEVTEVMGSGDDIVYIVKNPTHIKLADAVTYDDAGEVIPLSKRFNYGSVDIRASRNTAAKHLASAADKIWITPTGEVIHFPSTEEHCCYAYTTIYGLGPCRTEVQHEYAEAAQLQAKILKEGWVRGLPDESGVGYSFDASYSDLNETILSVIFDLMRDKLDQGLEVSLDTRHKFYSATNKIELGRMRRNITGKEAVAAAKNTNKQSALISKAKEYDTAADFIRAFYQEEWSDELAFGYTNGLQLIDPKLLNIKWDIDWEQATPFDAPIEELPPIEVAYENGKLYVEDGHHRLKTALAQNKPIMMDLTIKQSPVTALGLSGDKDLEDIWKKAHNMNITTANKQTESPEFKEWFSGSVVVDDAGNPLPVYHGSQNPDLKFRSGSAAYFTSSRETADSFADRSAMGEKLLPGEVPTTYIAYLSIKNPKVITTVDEYEDIFQDSSAGRKAVQDEGYDGIIYFPEDDSPDYYVVFYPEQVKLVGDIKKTAAPPKRDLSYANQPNKQTESPEFQSWFSGSKVVNADGSPKKMFRGQASWWNRDPLNLRYFTEDPDYAATYGDTDDNPQVILAVYISIKNPWTPATMSEVEDFDWWKKKEQLMADGYDGIIGGDSKIVIPFYPNQVKSAFGNKGTFDPASTDITSAKTTAAIDVHAYNGFVTAYHGHRTDRPLKEFDFSISEMGIHFSVSPVIAREHGPNLIEATLIFNNAYEAGSDLGNWGDLPSLKNMFAPLFEQAVVDGWKTWKDVRASLIAKGYDGIVYYSDFEGGGANSSTCYIVFDMKSVEVIAENIKEEHKSELTPIADILKTIKRPLQDSESEAGDITASKTTTAVQGTGDKYPTLAWVKSALTGGYYPFNRTPLEAYIVGSEAKGTAGPDSDLDIAVIIEPVRGKTALKVTEQYHMKYTSDALKPKWNGRTVDFQFFYPTDNELSGYSKITLSNKTGAHTVTANKSVNPILQVMKQSKQVEETEEVCPHCNKVIGEKSMYWPEEYRNQPASAGMTMQHGCGGLIHYPQTQEDRQILKDFGFAHIAAAKKTKYSREDALEYLLDDTNMANYIKRFHIQITPHLTQEQTVKIVTEALQEKSGQSDSFADTFEQFMGDEQDSFTVKELDEVYANMMNTFIYDNPQVYSLNEDKYEYDVWRMLTISDLEANIASLKENGTTVGHTGVGEYWAAEQDDADAYWGQFAPGQVKVVLHGKVSANSIDWEGTVYARIINDDENELRISEGTAINLIEVIDSEGVSYPINKTVTAAKKSPALPSDIADWFSGSKVVDKKGNPLPMYHGTKAQFKDFKVPDNDGLYFASEKEYAELYSEEGGTMYKTFLSIKNPLVLDGDEEELVDQFTSNFYKPEDLRAQGYDGVILQFSDGEMNAMVFDVGQIKTAPVGKKTTAVELNEDPFEYQDNNQEVVIHSGWPKGNNYRYVLEGTGDIFRQIAISDTKSNGKYNEYYIDEKVDRIIRHIDKERSGRMHPDDTFETCANANGDKIATMLTQWENQPTTSELQKKAVELNVYMLAGMFDTALTLANEINTEVAGVSAGKKTTAAISDGWVSPDGVFNAVEGDHASWAFYEILKDLPEYQEMQEDSDFDEVSYIDDNRDDIFRASFAAGWVRISDSGRAIQMPKKVSAQTAAVVVSDVQDAFKTNRDLILHIGTNIYEVPADNKPALGAALRAVRKAGGTVIGKKTADNITHPNLAGLLFRGMGKEEAAVSAAAGALTYYSKDPMSTDWEVIKHSIGDSANSMTEDEVSEWVAGIVGWEASAKGVNLTTDFDNAKGYGEYVACVEASGDIAEFSKSYVFAKEPTECVVKYLYDVTNDSFVTPEQFAADTPVLASTNKEDFYMDNTAGKTTRAKDYQPKKGLGKYRITSSSKPFAHTGRMLDFGMDLLATEGPGNVRQAASVIAAMNHTAGEDRARLRQKVECMEAIYNAARKVHNLEKTTESFQLMEKAKRDLDRIIEEEARLD